VGQVETVSRSPSVPALRGLRRLGAASLAGALAGVVVGGIGGRLAMLLLRLTSDASLHGLKTDDGFTIGIVSGETTFLLTITFVIGATGGVVYLATRSLVPERRRVWVWAALGAAIGGAEILRPHGIDFTLLDPLPLAVAMFVAIPAAGAAATSILAERFLGPSSSSNRRNRWLLGLPPFVLIAGVGPRTLLAVTITLIFATLQPRLGRLGAFWSSPPVMWVGRGGLALAGAVASIALIQDVAEIL
jgi:hypothetical protein